MSAKRCSCSSSGYSSQSLTSDYEQNRQDKKQMYKYSHNNSKNTFKRNQCSKKSFKTPNSLPIGSACNTEACSRSLSSNICNQTSNSTITNTSSSFCIRTSTPTSYFTSNTTDNHMSNSQNLINYNYSSSNTSGRKSLIDSTSSNYSNMQQHKVFMIQSLNKNLASSISTITSEADSLRTSTTTTSTTHLPADCLNNKKYSNFIYPIKEQHHDGHHKRSLHGKRIDGQQCNNNAISKLAAPVTNKQSNARTPEQPKNFSFWSFLYRIFSCFNIFSLFLKKSSNHASLYPPNIEQNVFSVSSAPPLVEPKHEAIYNADAYSTAISNYSMSNAFKSKHSTPKSQQELTLDVNSPVLLNAEINSVRSVNNLAYIDAESQGEELYDNVPLPSTPVSSVQEPVVKLQLLMLNRNSANATYTSNTSSKSFSSPISRSSPLNKHFSDQIEQLQDKHDEYYIKMNPLHLKLKQLETDALASTTQQISVESLSRNNQQYLSSTSSLNSNESNETNYDNDLEMIVKRQAANITTSSATESAFSCHSINNLDGNRMLNYTNSCFKSLPTSSSASSSSICSIEMSNSSSLSTDPHVIPDNHLANIKTNTNEQNEYYLSMINLTSSQKQQPHHSLQSKCVLKKVQIKYPVIEQQRQFLQYKNSYHFMHAYTKRNQSFNLKRKVTSGGPIYEDYLCDKEVESYFDNPVYFDYFKNQVHQQHTMPPSQEPPPVVSAALIAKSSDIFYCDSNSGIMLINKSSKLFKPHIIKPACMKLIGAECVRKKQGESFC